MACIGVVAAGDVRRALDGDSVQTAPEHGHAAPSDDEVKWRKWRVSHAFAQPYEKAADEGRP
jgi:hypothetical protein